MQCTNGTLEKPQTAATGASCIRGLSPIFSYFRGKLTKTSTFADFEVGNFCYLGYYSQILK